MKFAVITVAAAMFAAAAPVQAQQPQQERPRAEARAQRMDPAKRIERRVQVLDQKLNLSDDQAARIKTILTQESEQMKSHFQGCIAKADRKPGERAERPKMSEAARDSVRAVMKERRERTDAAILQVLSADQRSQYEKLKSEMKDRGERGKRGGERKQKRDA